MTKQEIINRIKALEAKKDYLSFKDFWNSEDYKDNREWNDELISLRKQLAVMD